MNEPNKNLINLVLNSADNKLLNVDSIELSKMLVNQMIGSNIQKDKEHSDDNILTVKDTVPLQSLGVMYFNGHNGRFFYGHYRKTEGTYVKNGVVKKITKPQPFNPNSIIDYPVSSVLTDCYGLHAYVPPVYKVDGKGEPVKDANGNKIITNSDVGHPLVGYLTLDIEPAKVTNKHEFDQAKMFGWEVNGRKNYFRFEHLEKIFGSVTLHYEDIWHEESYSKVPMVKGVKDRYGKMLATTGVKNGKPLSLPATDFEGNVDPLEEVLWFTLSFHDMGVESIGRLFEYVYRSFLLDPIALECHPYVVNQNGKPWDLLGAHPSWVIDGNQANIVISAHNVEEKVFKRVGIEKASQTVKNKLMVRFFKDVANVRLSDWFDTYFLVYPDRYLNDDKDIKTNDGVGYWYREGALPNGYWGLGRGEGYLKSKISYAEAIAKGIKVEGWFHESYMLKWANLGPDQVYCGFKGRIECYKEMAEHFEYGTQGAYVIRVRFYISRNECRDRSKDNYLQNGQPKIQGNLDKERTVTKTFYKKNAEGMLEVHTEAYPCIEFYEETRRKAARKAANLINDFNSTNSEVRSERVISLLNTMDMVWKQDEGIVTNSMRAKAFLGLLTKREIPKAEESAYKAGIKSWEANNAIWSGITFTEFLRINGQTIYLEENSVYVSEDMYKLIKAIAKRLHVSLDGLPFTMMRHPITTEHSILSVSVAGTTNGLIGNHLWAHPLLGKLMQGDGDDFVQFILGLLSLAKISKDIEPAFDKTPTKEDPSKLTPWTAYVLGRWFQDHIGSVSNLLYRVRGALNDFFQGQDRENRIGIAEVVIAKALHTFAQGVKDFVKAGVTEEELLRRLSEDQIVILGGTQNLAKIASLSETIEGMRKIGEKICTTSYGNMTMYGSKVAQLQCPSKSGKYVRLEAISDAFYHEFGLTLPKVIQPPTTEGTLVVWELSKSEEELYLECLDILDNNTGKMAHRKVVQFLLAVIVNAGVVESGEKYPNLALEIASWVGEKEINWARANGAICASARVYTRLVYELHAKANVKNPTLKDELVSEAFNAGVVLLAGLIPANYKMGKVAIADYLDNLKQLDLPKLVGITYAPPIPVKLGL